MSVIYGLVNPNEAIDQSIIYKIKSSLEFPIDLHNDLINNELYFSCAQKSDSLSKDFDSSPLEDKSLKLSITADCALYNRDELISLLGIKLQAKSKIPNSSIILKAYQKWGFDCPKYLIGDFAFAIWDEKNKTLFCARDHVGKRTFYYSINKNKFAFSTLMNPILQMGICSDELNQQYLADFLSIPGVAHEFESDTTIYEHIKQLPPAHCLIYTKQDLKLIEYWNPFEQARKNYKNESDYTEEFLDIFTKSVDCRIKGDRNIGIMLSGGMDSGSVACVAAKILQSQNKTLKAYTLVPVPYYKECLPTRLISNEKNYVDEILKSYPNIEIQYKDFEETHSLTYMDKYLSILEQPFKSVENMFWLNEIASTASQDGCHVLLDGQFGNATISNGNIYTHAYTLIKRRKYREAYNSLCQYSKLYKTSKKTAIKSAIPLILPNLNFPSPLISRLPTSINPKFMQKHKVIQRIAQNGYSTSPFKKYDYFEMQKLLAHPAAFSHMGAIETKLSIANGITKRDPTRDKRLIEFCMSLPPEAYVKNGEERSLIRNAMQDILPDKIRLNYTHKGRQSADWIQRLSRENEFLQKSISNKLETSQLVEYLNIPKLKILNNSFSTSGINYSNSSELRTLLIAYIFGAFMERRQNA